ncbi:MAG: hypothetical protein AB1921_20540 [Thermodesulfobacteriota bacterium]
MSGPWWENIEETTKPIHYRNYEDFNIITWAFIGLTTVKAQQMTAKKKFKISKGLYEFELIVKLPEGPDGAIAFQKLCELIDKDSSIKEAGLLHDKGFVVFAVPDENMQRILDARKSYLTKNDSNENEEYSKLRSFERLITKKYLSQ